MIKILFSKVITMFFLISRFHQTMEREKKTPFQHYENQVAFHFDVFSYFVSVLFTKVFFKKVVAFSLNYFLIYLCFPPRHTFMTRYIVAGACRLHYTYLNRTYVQYELFTVIYICDRYTLD